MDTSGIIILASFVSVFVLIFFVIPKFYRRKISKIFYKEGSDVMYVVTNALSTTMTKMGIIENHRVFFNKLNIHTGEILFTTKIKSFSVKMLYGFSGVIGMNDEYTFFLMSGNRFYVVENVSGKVILTLRQLKKNYPGIKKMKAEEIKYDSIQQTVIFSDDQGYYHKLEPAEKILVKYQGKISEEKSTTGFIEIDDYKLTKLNREESSIHAFNQWHSPFDETKSIYKIQKEGSERKYLVYGNPNDKISETELHDDLLEPVVILSGLNKDQFLKNTEKFLVLHFHNFNSDANEMLISCMGGNSKIGWTIKADHIISKPQFSSDTVLFFEQVDDVLFFFYYYKNTSSNKMSISKVDCKSGAVLMKPLMVKF